MLKLQNRWSNVTFFKKKNTFPQKIPPDARTAVETNWEKIYRPSVFWIKLQRSVEESEKFQICFFPQKLPRIPRLRVSKNWRKFLLEGKKLLWIGKNSECLSFEKKFQILFQRTSIAVLPTLIKLFRHCPENFKNYPKILKFSRLPFGNVAL